MKRTALFAALLSLICGMGFGKASAQDLMLGYLAANTGPFSSLARRNAVAIELAIDDINAKGGVNGKKLTLSSFDTGGKPEQAVAGVSHFAQDLPVLAVIGPFSTSECRVAFPAGERLAIPEMSMASSAPKVAAPYTYAFRNTTDEAYTFERLFQTVKAKNIPHASASIAYATDDAVSQSLGTAVLPAALKNADIPVLETVSFRVAAFDLAPEVSQIMQKPADLIPVGTPPESLLKLVAELRRQGYTGRLLGGSTVADAELPARMGANGEGTLITSTFFGGMDDEATRKFVSGFKAKLQQKGEPVVEPNQFDAASYDIVSMYAWAMAQAGVTGDPAKLAQERTAIRDKIRTLKDSPRWSGRCRSTRTATPSTSSTFLRPRGASGHLMDKHVD